MDMGMNPERPARMVGGDWNLVLKRLAGRNREEGVVGIPAGRNVQPVKVQIRFFRQTVPEEDAQGIAGAGFQHWAGDTAVVGVEEGRFSANRHPILRGFEVRVHKAGFGGLEVCDCWKEKG